MLSNWGKAKKLLCIHIMEHCEGTTYAFLEFLMT